MASDMYILLYVYTSSIIKIHTRIHTGEDSQSHINRSSDSATTICAIILLAK